LYSRIFIFTFGPDILKPKMKDL